MRLAALRFACLGSGWLVLSTGCAGFATRAESSPAWREATASGDEALAHGDPLVAAAHYRHAERAATREKDRREAAYRRARALWRGGRSGAAAALFERLFRTGAEQGARSVRAARAGLDLGLLRRQAGADDQALQCWGQLIRRFPRTPMAAVGLERAVTLLHHERGPRAALQWLRAHASTAPPRSELAEERLWLLGVLQAELGRATDAQASWRALLRRFPPPRGRRWDEALWHLADLAERTGRLREAIAYLHRLAEQHEPTHLIGSYTRARMPAAWLRAADLTARLGRREEADGLYLRFVSRFADSRLRDDALLAAARLWLPAGDIERACARLKAASDVRPGGAARREAARLFRIHCHGRPPSKRKRAAPLEGTTHLASPRRPSAPATSRTETGRHRETVPSKRPAAVHRSPSAVRHPLIADCRRPTPPARGRWIARLGDGRGRFTGSQKSMDGMSPPPALSFLSSGSSATSASVVSISPATLAAFCSAERTTLVGSMTPEAIRSS